MAKAYNPANLGAEARKAMSAVSEALVEWRDETAASTERYIETVSEKIGQAARAVGWPDQVVEASRAHLLQTSKIQTRMLDQLIDAWQQQLKSPVPEQFISRLRLSGAGLNDPADIAGLATKQVELWMQATMAWQRNLASAWSSWAETTTRRRDAH